MDINTILNLAVKEKASDVHLKAGIPPVVRICGSLTPVKNLEKLTPDWILKTAMQILSEPQKEALQKNLQIDFAYNVSELGRFRVNIFRQKGGVSIALRVIPAVVHSFDNLHIPEIIKKIAAEQRGLVLVTGITGSGKSTTLAAIIDYINSNRTSHIITVEDPIEFIHKDKRCIINQREIGTDAISFADALRGALRQDPDVIMVGEMRDMETIEIALTAAETGHLVLSTLHTIDALETINRIISVFPPHQHQQIRVQLAGVIKAIISQRLMPMKDGKGRVPAIEIMVSTAFVRECIEDKDKTKSIHDAIAKGYTTYGMQTFDQSIFFLLNKNYITYEEALRQASNPDDFALLAQGITSTSDMKWSDIESNKKGERGTQFDIERF
ncbi:MAG: type IV pilus twitching motility protein PilT [Deltaproteobacteria bacterium]|nr:type IV pilus twitching motility protein PilT [Deltaproteobacteria bacterium]